MPAQSLWSLAVLTALVSIAAAQQPAFKRTEVQRGALSAAGREVVQAIADIPVGAASGRHTHPGEEVAYVLEGTITVEMDGKPATTYKAGQGFIVPAGQIHNAKGATAARVLATYIIEQGKPVATPVP